MKISKNRIYPYPIYSELSDDYKNNDFSLEADIEYDSETASLQLEVNLEDEVIRELIINRLVGLYCHVECSSTKYRELFELSLNTEDSAYNIEIPLFKLNDNIEVMCMLVAKENIASFADDNLGDLYEGEKIRFPQYGTIGFTDTTELTLIKRMDINGDIPSVFTIVASEEEKEIQTEFNGDQIEIFIPKDQYEIYENYKGTGIRVKQMMVIIPALIEVLDIIKTGEGGYDDLPWFIVIEEAIKKLNYTGFDDDNFKNKPSFELAQEILGDIAKDAFNEFDAMNKDKDD